jgi:hypothetical protein
MITLTPDNYSNLSEASKSQDLRTLEDIFADTLSDIVSYHPQSAIDLLEESGIKIDPKSKQDVILQAILANLPDNQKLQLGFGYLYVQNNDMLANLQKEDTRQEEPSGELVVRVSRQLQPVYEALRNSEVAGRVYNRAVSHLSVKDEKGEYVVAEKKSGKALYWIIGLAAVGIAAYLIYRNMNKAKAVAPVASPTPTPVPAAA